MIHEKTSSITETKLYAGFDGISRRVLGFWKDSIVKTGDRETTLATIADINARLLSGNAITFFDHHYAFDALPVGLVLGQAIKNATAALIPYAVHLDMGVDPEGLPSLRYRLRTVAFQWLIKNVQNANPNVHILSVAREFELMNPRLRGILDRRFSGLNTRYLKKFSQLFSHYKQGLVCIVSPTAGIAFPGKATLHPQIYRSMEMAQSKQGHSLPFYFVSAYPRLQAHYHYLAPLLTRHTFVARGPFYLPVGNYERAQVVVDKHLNLLRQAAHFSPPDYARIEHK
jgi:hypothetical protein